MKKLLICLTLLGCSHKVSNDSQYEDTTWYDESPIDTFVINRIYNAERMEDIFPSDTLNEGPSYEEWFGDTLGGGRVAEDVRL